MKSKASPFWRLFGDFKSFPSPQKRGEASPQITYSDFPSTFSFFSTNPRRELRRGEEKSPKWNPGNLICSPAKTHLVFLKYGTTPKISFSRSDPLRVLSTGETVEITASEASAGEYVCKAVSGSSAPVEASASVLLEGPPVVTGAPSVQWADLTGNSSPFFL